MQVMVYASERARHCEEPNDRYLKEAILKLDKIYFHHTFVKAYEGIKNEEFILF